MSETFLRTAFGGTVMLRARPDVASPHVGAAGPDDLMQLLDVQNGYAQVLLVHRQPPLTGWIYEAATRSEG